MSTQAGKRLGLLVCKPEAVQRLSEPLEQCGWVISRSVVLADGQLDTDNSAGLFESANAIVVDLDGADNRQLDHLNELVSAEVLPVLFNDSSQDSHWSQRLNDKLTEVISATGLTVSKVQARYDGSNDIPLKRDQQVQAETDTHNMSGNVWLLSGSLGGPEALREFFSALSPGLPVSFIVMQRIAKEHIDVLAKHLRHYTDYSVSAMDGASALYDGAVLLVADGSCFSIDSRHKLLPDTVSPCDHVYDEMMAVLAERYGANASAIVFSAIGEDGVAGCRKILASGGRVWLQEDLTSYFDQLADEYDGDRFDVAASAVLAQRLNALYE
ncbi:chemotaxis protein CheB [Gammaproteobacteria bacterium AH-315-C21]|nr:chemotaxis protein CheB [Gammaproteobacteria bacterium AH-315-C21]